MKKTQVQEPGRTIKRIVLGDGIVIGDPLPEQLEPERTIKSIVLNGVEYGADGVVTVLANPLPDWVELLRVGETVVTNANKARTIRYIVLDNEVIG